MLEEDRTRASSRGRIAIAWLADRPHMFAAKSSTHEWRSFPLLFCPANETLDCVKSIGHSTVAIVLSTVMLLLGNRYGQKLTAPASRDLQRACK